MKIFGGSEPNPAVSRVRFTRRTLRKSTASGEEHGSPKVPRNPDPTAYPDGLETHSRAGFRGGSEPNPAVSRVRFGSTFWNTGERGLQNAVGNDSHSNSTTSATSHGRPWRTGGRAEVSWDSCGNASVCCRGNFLEYFQKFDQLAQGSGQFSGNIPEI